MMEVKHLSFSAGGRQILSDISFTAEKGSMTCIIGPNGCGKSTLLAHLSRRLPSRNAVFLDGKAIETIPRKEYAQNVAVMVQQGMGMAGELLAKEVVLMGRYPFKDRFSDYSEADREAARRALFETGAAPLAERRMKHMSGGEKQRVLIAKAFAQEPSMLLMDEPTNHLDVKYKVALMDHLERFHHGRTVIVVLHDLSLAARYCDYAIVMKEGRIIDKGTTEETLTQEKMSALFEVPFHTGIHEGKRFLYC